MQTTRPKKRHCATTQTKPRHSDKTTASPAPVLTTNQLATRQSPLTAYSANPSHASTRPATTNHPATRQSPLTAYLTNPTRTEAPTVTPLHPEQTLRFATVNVQGNLPLHLPELLKLLDKENIDLLAVIDHGRTADSLRHLQIPLHKYAHYWAPIRPDLQQTHNTDPIMHIGGVGLITRPRLEAYRLGEPLYTNSRQIQVTYALPKRQILTVTALYGPTGKENLTNKLLREIKLPTSESHIILGDFNLTVDERIDAARNHTTPNTHATQNLETQSIMMDKQLYDTYRLIHGKKARAYTYTWTKNEKVTHRRIDHVWVTANLVAQTTDAGIIADHAIGDHSIAWADVRCIAQIKHQNLPQPIPFARRRLPPTNDPSWTRYEHCVSTAVNRERAAIDGLVNAPDTQQTANDISQFIARILTTAVDDTWVQKTKPTQARYTNAETRALRTKRRKIKRAESVLAQWHAALQTATTTDSLQAKLTRRLRAIRQYQLYEEDLDIVNTQQITSKLQTLRSALKIATREHKKAFARATHQDIRHITKKLIEQRKANVNQIFKITSKRQHNPPITAVLATDTNGNQTLTGTPEECAAAVHADWRNYWETKGPRTRRHLAPTRHGTTRASRSR